MNIVSGNDRRPSRSYIIASPGVKELISSVSRRYHLIMLVVSGVRDPGVPCIIRGWIQVKGHAVVRAPRMPPAQDIEVLHSYLGPHSCLQRRRHRREITHLPLKEDGVHQANDFKDITLISEFNKNSIEYHYVWFIDICCRWRLGAEKAPRHHLHQ